ncbi:21S rRNA (uridine2791-2'-O) methyltransferase [Pichia kluyveri]|uniref:rRNA methyltransferase 2, mitochondrial n=1 Tax=Pichia kluyveri TaxID=36015 RepID=A0AAV5QZ82_PICKL|nr:21S rRNA (uridine2791-2'-O) methyltransferase [Pichia kluyveri]
MSRHINVLKSSILMTIRNFSTSISLLSNSSSSNRWLNRQNSDFYTRRAKAENLKSRAAFKLLQIDEKFHIFNKSSNNGKSLNVLDLGAAPGAWNQVALERCSKNSKILGVDILPYQPPNGASALQGNILSKGTHLQIKNFFKLSALEKKNKIFDDVEIVSNNDTSDKTLINSDVSIIEKEAELSLLTKKLNINDNIDNDNENENPNDINDNDKIENKYPVDVVLSDMYVPFIQPAIAFRSKTTNNPYFRMANTTGLAFKDHTMSMDLCDAALITAIDLLKKNGSFVVKFFTGEEDKLLEKRLLKVFKKVHRFKPKACRLESRECYFVALHKRDYEIDKVRLFAN